MRAIVGGERDLLDRPALAVGQVLLLQPFEELQHARQSLLMIDVGDGRMIAGRIGRYIVLQRHGNVDQLSRHALAPYLVATSADPPHPRGRTRPRRGSGKPYLLATSSAS